MPKAVNELLEKGYFYLATFKGLEGIENEGISDKKIRNKYRKMLEVKSEKTGKFLKLERPAD
ncbi:hypothetical protein [Dehalogenimonas etheniformans]|uniref:Uncharacterized protein n=1 Tax=Dehalogenimonas etheniformans TaxID=1536648 RepID=A0A2P5P7B1_9CHLR|nr:hypothetical protein [Dehalogenimonas etheniformans]PPD58175.1 hypothetical protein JP09_005125 [Dehalogenimonas etheniformans]QNT75584.1 hypothetical protein HX448_02220 [Dehalogenimonas etheniformans]